MLVAVVLWDVFHTLWHPSGQGSLSSLLIRAVWRAARRHTPQVRELAGPAALVVIIGSWLGLLLIGGALVYWPHMPGSFSYSPGLSPTRGTELVDAFYLSTVTTATLGFGDIVPTTSWLRVVSPLQALISFALLTAAATWVLQVYPALSRRRALSLQITSLRDAGLLEDIKGTGPTGARLIERLAMGVAQVRVDLTQYTETAYFVEADPDINLACTIRHAQELARTAQASSDPDLRLAGTVLAQSLDSFAARLAELLDTGGKDTEEVLRTYTAEMGSRGLRHEEVTAGLRWRGPTAGRR